MVKKHITPPKSSPRFPVLRITKFQYRVKLKCQQIEELRQNEAPRSFAARSFILIA
jgi:hypothetical protein